MDARLSGDCGKAEACRVCRLPVSPLRVPARPAPCRRPAGQPPSDGL